MTDKNGTEIQTGDIVEIAGAYFNSDNGLYYVEHSPGDPHWMGKDHSLFKIGRTGKVSTARNHICFYPITIHSNNLMQKLEGDVWNREHATIEIRNDIDNSYVIDEFVRAAKEYKESAEHESFRYGEDYFLAQELSEEAEFLQKVVERITEKRKRMYK